MSSVTVRVPGKVNLALAVGPPGLDGYHPIATVFHAVGIYDEVVATHDDTARAEGGVALAMAASVRGAVPGVEDVPLDSTNLACRAAVALATVAGIEPEVRLEIRKGIPVAGGMAGGSADAAATLLACDALWGLGMSRDELGHVAADLGADVPFLLHGGTALGHGRGEDLTPVLARGGFSWVFAVADGSLSTPEVYRECDRLREEAGLGPSGSMAPEPRVPDAVLSALRAGDPTTLGPALSNDLQAAALSLRPALSQVLDVGADYGALGGVVSGSGPTCAFLVRDEEHALDLTVALSASGVCRTVLRAHGPVHGARVIDQVG
jgi:4-diphosphocytidyl-2-C-methyl-D-erythritol kinase